MDRVGEAERVIEWAGCGRFQALAVLVLYNLCSIPAFFTGLFMIYGNYNPGWRCVDQLNDTEDAMSIYDVIPLDTNRSQSFPNTNNSILSREKYSIGSCVAYESCRNVEFNPDSSTLVTEWNLLCSRSWGVSVIICVQMMGMLAGAYLAGQMQDSFGRKKTLYSFLFITGILHIILSFSVNWEMFATVQFFAGGLNAGIMNCYYVHLQEFLTKKYRAPVFGIPAFNTGGILFALLAMWLRDWRQLQLMCSVICFVAFIPVIWIPESLRWLEVNDKRDQFVQVANKIAKLNGKDLLLLDDMNLVVSREKGDIKKIRRHTILDLFHKGYRMYAVIIGAHWFSITCVYFAVYFGIKSLYGSFYINLLLMDMIEIPFCIVRIVAPNLIGRKKSTILYFTVTTICLYIIALLYVYSSGNIKTVGTVVFAIVAKLTNHANFDLVYTYTPEIYPTVVRGLSVGWGSALARVGGLASAFLIPSDPDTYFINYAVMGSMGLICSVATLGLPETRGRSLKETFQDGDTDSQRQNSVIIAENEKISESL